MHYYAYKNYVCLQCYCELHLLGCGRHTCIHNYICMYIYPYVNIIWYTVLCKNHVKLTYAYLDEAAKQTYLVIGNVLERVMNKYVLMYVYPILSMWVYNLYEYRLQYVCRQCVLQICICVCTCTYVGTCNIKLLIQHVGLMDYLYGVLRFVSGDKPYYN